jgi:hypothetical protein
MELLPRSPQAAAATVKEYVTIFAISEVKPSGITGRNLIGERSGHAL